MTGSSTAPGRLEQVRTFLNTWRVPHETRTATDDLPELISDPQRWRSGFPDIPPPQPNEIGELLDLRTDLRAALGNPAPAELVSWFASHPVVVAVGDDAEPIRYLARDAGTAAALLAKVAVALADHRWARLKSCPDCRNVFYDHSRNHSRTWCSMYAETPDGRACGSIAKVRNYRNRQRGNRE
ncbi:CGNR zinc finger domain-containing protein [Nocardia sp. BMG111209]|uniref:CGNR zinc finger domain-containing protein n=1 Tax=Nocardia sp. BMG111209 TaxID=1160137 RepID=UPI00036E07CA|nr:CGNR zinc finger domain-containing protein [Nocardia sp. BMG111209]